MSRRPDDGADESPPDDVPLIGCLLAPGGFLLGALILFAHAKVVGGAAEDHIGWQSLWGSIIGAMAGVILFGAVEEYRKVNNVARHAAAAARDRPDKITVWRWLRTGTGVLLILLLLFVLAGAIWLISDPNLWTSLPE